ncbi:hypothetical protein MAR_018037 [Mya arenaria]|uniref:Uncharacterized protein n=1 Tax=Mya arenaria TaxID=6604 RepID=A0ABY7EG68_MYAAR|nr:hypothetical protein MAR_018037 [Mya arenaria]
MRMVASRTGSARGIALRDHGELHGTTQRRATQYMCSSINSSDSGARWGGRRQSEIAKPKGWRMRMAASRSPELDDHVRYEIFVSCMGLVYMDTLSKSDPICARYKHF